MWIVVLALRRPISIAVMALLMMVLGALSFELMNVDIFPAINLPVVLEYGTIPGLSAFQSSAGWSGSASARLPRRLMAFEHIDSSSMNGTGYSENLLSTRAQTLARAIAQISSVSESILSQLPRGTVPPQIISYDAANVPVAQLNIFSEQLSEEQLFDYGLNFIRIQLFTIPGFSSPAPLGGVQRDSHGESGSDDALFELACRRPMWVMRLPRAMWLYRQARPRWVTTSMTSI